jgi:hypothetical protein
MIAMGDLNTLRWYDAESFEEIGSIEYDHFRPLQSQV